MYNYYDLKNLPILDSKRRVLQTSSFDRAYENADWGQYLYEENGQYVLFDEVGEGCIKSIWMAVTNEATALKFYFDGSDTPRWETTTKGLFNGGIPELDGVGNSFEIRGHYDEDDCHAGNCFIEIPYEKGLRIVAEGEKKVFYHIIYETYADGKLSEMTAGNAMEKAFALDVPSLDGMEVFETSATVKKGYNTLFHRKEAGVIRELTIICDESADLSEINLDMSWDGFRASCGACPLEYLFAQPFGCTEVNSYVVSNTVSDGKRTMSFRMPMPFWERAGLCFVKQTEGEVDLTLRVVVDKNDYDKANTGYFCADYENGKTQLFSDWRIGEFWGRGHVVGLVQTCIGGQYCEGNEHFYINGALTPRINGTGTEDLYLACYWPNLKFDSPLAGCVNDVYLENGSTLPGAFKTPIGYYRYFLDAPIAFENGIKLNIQHGAVSQTYSDYSSLCLSYRTFEPSLFETDFINLESEASKMLHAYSCGGEEYTHISKLESDMRAPMMRRRGYRSNGGSVIFKICINEDNDGAVIRRLYDQTQSNRGAEVYVDGKYAGVWNCPGINTFFGFADDDFYIPACLTEGKGLIDIEIKCGEFYSDFEYKVFSRKKSENKAK